MTRCSWWTHASGARSGRLSTRAIVTASTGTGRPCRPTASTWSPERRMEALSFGIGKVGSMCRRCPRRTRVRWCVARGQSRISLLAWNASTRWSSGSRQLALARVKLSAWRSPAVCLVLRLSQPCLLMLCHNPLRVTVLVARAVWMLRSHKNKGNFRCRDANAHTGIDTGFRMVQAPGPTDEGQPAFAVVPCASTA